MLADILTWAGAVLGVTVLLAMALGAVALDYGDVRGRRGPERSNTPTR